MRNKADACLRYGFISSHTKERVGLRHHALRQQFRDLNRVQGGSLQQLVCRGEYRDRMAGGIAEIPANAADQDVVLA